MINLGQLRIYVIRPALERIGLWSLASENLVLGTGLVESGYTWIDQTTPGPGPAYGLWQMEEPTYIDTWSNFIAYQPHSLRTGLMELAGSHRTDLIPPIAVLHGNLFYAAAMCRVHYRRVKEALPAADDFVNLAGYWKRYYNTSHGAGTIEKAIPLFKQAVSV